VTQPSTSRAAGSVTDMMVDVTDSTFQSEVLDRSMTTPVVVDLWAPWCGPCKTLGPMIEKIVDETGGAVVLAKINVDENPQASAAFRVQSIPAVYALHGGQVVDGFIGAQPESVIREFVGRLAPGAGAPSEVDQLVARGDEASLRQALELEADDEGAVTALAALLIDDGRTDEALGLLERIPASEEGRRLAALARTGVDASATDVGARLAELLPRVKGDEEARQEYVDLLEVLGATHPDTAAWRKRLSSTLY
jgi:putative thioredoxin